MNIIISNTTDIPIYQQITNQIKEAIFTKSISEGDMLPSIRSLAKDLRISVITTTRAYNELEQEGFITTVPGKGCYVLPQNTELIKEQKQREIEEHLQRAIDMGKLVNLGKKEMMEMINILYEENDNE
ncbi:MAG: GntR family transcriptional regulator [Eubacteriales bacterium]